MKKARLAILVLAVMSWMGSVQAQEYDRPPSSAPAQPETGVGHISLIHGDVSMQRGDSGDWVASTLNTPVVRGDQVATGEESRTEIQLDYANVLRLSARSQAKVADLTRTRIQLQIAQGYANFSTFKGSEADVEIDTPNVAVRPLKHGRYRIQVNSDSETDVIVREGEAEITTPQGSTTVKEGQQITVRGADAPEYKIADAPGKDDWDRWNKDRDHVIQEAEGWRRTNRYYTGVNDLDTYGHWVLVPGYGWVWAPYQNAGWAPYQSGRWVWEPYYGWTWVSYEPWGWAPYHYGRWFVQAGYWYWWPGPVVPRYRPVWAPAYVFFLGFGRHVDFGFGFSSIGWLPCGPHDYFYPWYGRGFNRINVVNVTNINVTNINREVVIQPLGVRGRQPFRSNANLALTDVRVRQGVTSVSMEEFNRGAIAGRRQGMDAAEFRQAQVVAGNLGVVPTRESLRPGSNASVAGAANITPRSVGHYFTRTQPPAGPAGFQQQANQVQEVVRAHGGSAQTTVSATPGMQPPGSNSGQRGNLGDERSIKPESGNIGRAGGQVPGSNSAAGPEAGKPVLTQPATNGWEKFGHAVEGGKAGGPIVASGSPAQAQAETGKPANSGGANSQSKPQQNDGAITGPKTGHEGWHSFGSGGSQNPGTTRPSGAAETGGKAPAGGGEAPGQNSGSHEGWQKFPSSNRGQSPDESKTNAPARTDGPAHSTGAPEEHSVTPSSTPKPPANNANQGGGWQKFPGPSDSSRGSRATDSAKPPLTIDRPIVTPRNGGNEPHNTATPPPHSEPRSAPPARNETRSAPPAARSSSQSHSGGGSSSHSGGGSEKSSSGSHSGKNNSR
jgi:hypothetical protein